MQLKTEHEVVIVGAGPVGLLLGCLLGQRGIHTLILEKRTQLPAQSRAIGITPPSLEILAQLGLDELFIQAGTPIREAHVHGDGGYLGCARFHELPSAYPFILSLPQQVHMGLLEQRLRDFPQVTLLRGQAVTEIQSESERVRFHGPGIQGRARWLIGCDGHQSGVRQQLAFRHRQGQYGCHFVMGDFLDHSGFGAAAHLWFGAAGAVESFPLGSGLRRWIVQTPAPMPQPAEGYIPTQVRCRTGLELAAADQKNTSSFSPRWLQVERYHQGRVVLCGDAAHVISPIGGQGMNAGWADAEHLAQALTQILRHQAPAEPLLAGYDQRRHSSVNVAMRRAAQGMWLGTRTGRWASCIRDFFLSQVLSQPFLSAQVGLHFSMLTLPHCTLARSRPV
jgi:2-polyprenyl-6-methoxyphenol hydroxylase-like FAD-dependent oxidoreductase